MTLWQQKTDRSLIHDPLSSKSICYSMITESTTPRNEVLPKSQTPTPQSVCVWLSLSLSLSLSLFTPTFPVWPRHPAGIFWDHFPWLISSQLISDDWRLTTPPAMHSLCGSPHHMHDTCERDRSRIPLLLLLLLNHRFLCAFRESD